MEGQLATIVKEGTRYPTRGNTILNIEAFGEDIIQKAINKKKNNKELIKFKKGILKQIIGLAKD